MRVRLRVSGESPEAAERVYAWWTDYGAGDHETPGFRRVGRLRRTILGVRGDGRVARFEDRGRVLGIPFWYVSRLAYEPPFVVRESSAGNTGVFEAEYRFEARPRGGTRVTYAIEGESAPGWPSALALLARPLLPGVARYDLARHLEDFARSA